MQRDVTSALAFEYDQQRVLRFGADRAQEAEFAQVFLNEGQFVQGDWFGIFAPVVLFHELYHLPRLARVKRRQIARDAFSHRRVGQLRFVFRLCPQQQWLAEQQATGDHQLYSFHVFSLLQVIFS